MNSFLWFIAGFVSAIVMCGVLEYVSLWLYCRGERKWDEKLSEFWDRQPKRVIDK